MKFAVVSLFRGNRRVEVCEKLVVVEKRKKGKRHRLAGVDKSEGAVRGS